jgi:carboxylesterase type B
MGFSLPAGVDRTGSGVHNGFSLYAELTPAQQQLSRQMIAYWGAFVRTGVPSAPGSPGWPRYSPGSSGRAPLMSLRPGDATRVIDGREFAAEHQCSFWNGPGKGAEG